MELLAELNEKQQQAVVNTDGPVLIIAGAGSGKTKALTHRIAYLIKEKGVNPWNILAVTFTNKAASEMKERIAQLLGIEYEPNSYYNQDMPIIGTFHSICVRILRKEIHYLGYENNFVIYDAADQKALVKQIMKRLNINDRQFNPGAILSHISSAKNQLISPEGYKRYVNNVFTEQVSNIYSHYQKALEQAQALDFDDIIFKTVVLFRDFDDVLIRYQEKFHYINVDEYQDTNNAQYTLINMLAQMNRNICVVGDDWQSIYSWRGADIQNILDFSKDYPEAKIIKLEQNYRSTQTILDAADHVIKKNKNRTEKTLWTDNNAGEKLKMIRAENERHEAEIMAREIERLMMRNISATNYQQFVILYRTNAQSRTVEEIFMRYGIPYKIVGGVKFYERKEIKDMIAYLRVIQNPADSVSLLRIINVPARKIGPSTITKAQEYAVSHGISLYAALREAYNISSLSESKQKSLLNFVQLIEELRNANREFAAAGVIKNVLITAKYKEYLLADNTEEGEVRFENVQELISVASKYDQLEPGISLATFLEEVSLIADIDSLDEQKHAVTLMTLHAAKGLEFPYVFICGLEEGVFPHSRSLLDLAQLEEERRLMYVGITRSKEMLYLLCAKRRLLYGESRANSPSQFLADIPEELIAKTGFDSQSQTTPLRPVPLESQEIDDFAQPEPEEREEFLEGDHIMHKTFGEGIVRDIAGGVITIAFKDPRIGIKKLALSVAPLEKKRKE